MITARIAIRLVAAALVAASASTACSEPDRGPLPSPSSAFPATGTTRSAASGSTGVTDGLPTTSGAEAGTFSRGRVTMEVSGDLAASRTIRTLITAVYSRPPGSLAIVWTAGGADATTVGIGGVSFTGTRPTAPALSLTLTLQTATGITTFLSMSGECEITIEAASEAKLAGGFRCKDLAASDGPVVDVSATFEATG